MQLLYGRDKIDYKILSKSKGLSNAAANVLITDYLGYEFVQNQDEYSDVSKEPISFSYSVTDLDGYLTEDVILVSKNGRNLNYTTPSRYAHAKIFKIDENSFGKDFFDIFKYSFVDSRDSESYKNDEIDDFESQKIDLEKTAPLSKEVLETVLCLLFDNYREISKRVCIVVDEAGDKYNARSIDVIRQIYDNIPYFMKRYMGFVSYGTFNQIYSSRIKLVVMTKGSVGESANKLILDLANFDYSRYQDEFTAESKILADYILNLDEVGKYEFFNELSKDSSIDRKSILDLANICKARMLWHGKDDIEKMKVWMHNIINYEELEEEVFNIMLDDIEENLTSDIYNKYLKYILEKDENKSLDYLSESKDLYELLLFEDILSVDYKDDLKLNLEIDKEYVANWWMENIFLLLKNEFEGRDLLKRLEDEIKVYDLDLHGDNYKALKEFMKEKINQAIKSEEDKAADFILDEASSLDLLKNKIEKSNSLDELDEIIDLLEAKLEELQYPKNKLHIKQAYEDKFKEIIKILLKEEKDFNYKEIMSFVSNNKNYFVNDMEVFVKNEKVVKEKSIADSIDLSSVKNLSSLSEKQSLFLQGNELEKNKYVEEIIFEKLKQIVEKMDENQINDLDNITAAIKIKESFRNIKNIDDVYKKVKIFEDRNVDIKDFNFIEIYTNEMHEKVEEVDNLLGGKFNKDNFVFYLNIYDEKSYPMKYMYTDDLFKYITEGPKKSILTKLFGKKSEVNIDFLENNKELVDLINDIFKR